MALCYQWIISFILIWIQFSLVLYLASNFKLHLGLSFTRQLLWTVWTVTSRVHWYVFPSKEFGDFLYNQMWLHGILKINNLSGNVKEDRLSFSKRLEPYMLCWLESCQSHKSYRHLGRENFRWEDSPCRLACETFCWLMIDIRVPCPFLGGTGLGQVILDWASHREIQKAPSLISHCFSSRYQILAFSSSPDYSSWWIWCEMSFCMVQTCFAFTSGQIKLIWPVSKQYRARQKQTKIQRESRQS